MVSRQLEWCDIPFFLISKNILKIKNKLKYNNYKNITIQYKDEVKSNDNYKNDDLEQSTTLNKLTTDFQQKDNFFEYDRSSDIGYKVLEFFPRRPFQFYCEYCLDDLSLVFAWLDRGKTWDLHMGANNSCPGRLRTFYCRL